MHAFGGLGHVGQHRRRVEEARPVRHLAAAASARRPWRPRPRRNAATLSRVAALTSGPTSTSGSSPLPTFSVDHRASVNLSVKASATSCVDVEAVGGGAGLAQVAHLGQHRALDGGVDVGILEHQHRRVAAQFHRRLQRPGRRPSAAACGPTSVEPVKRDHAHPRVVQHMVDHRAGLPRGQHVDQALGHAGLFQQRHQRQHGQRRFRGRLDDAPGSRRPAPGRSCGCPSRPGSSTASPARRCPAGLCCTTIRAPEAGRVGDQPVGAHGLLREPAEELGGIGGLAHARRRRALPFSSVMSRAKSVSRAVISSHALRSTSARSRGLRAAHSGEGRRRRRPARRRASSSVAEATEASTLSSAGLSTSKRSPSTPGRQSPSM